MSRVVHFEIHASDPEKLIEFYRQVFGWRFERYKDMPYWVVITKEASEGPEGWGINGGLTVREGEPPLPESTPNAFVNVIGVADAGATYNAALAAGAGEALPPTHSEGVGILAYLRDPDGNLFGIIQPDADAMPDTTTDAGAEGDPGSTD